MGLPPLAAAGGASAQSRRTVLVRNTAHVARALASLLEKSSDTGYNVTASSFGKCALKYPCFKLLSKTEK